MCRLGSGIWFGAVAIAKYVSSPRGLFSILSGNFVAAINLSLWCSKAVQSECAAIIPSLFWSNCWNNKSSHECVANKQREIRVGRGWGWNHHRMFNWCRKIFGAVFVTLTTTNWIYVIDGNHIWFKHFGNSWLIFGATKYVFTCCISWW